jgi:hypothetical protein
MTIPVIPIALGVGGVLALLRATKLVSDKEKKQLPPPATDVGPVVAIPKQVPPIVNHEDSPRLMPIPKDQPIPVVPPPQVVDKTAGGNAIISIQPQNTTQSAITFEAQVKFQGKAIPEAHNLYDYLVKNGVKSTDKMQKLTLAFQKAHNADPNVVHTTGTVTEDGKYGPRTQAALTMYTGNPIPCDPGIPAGPVTGGIGAAALAASDLYAYLKTHKNDKTDVKLKALVKAFQHAVNTDPMYPGPSSMVPTAKIIKTKLTEDGIYGKNTSDALAVTTFERINP